MWNKPGPKEKRKLVMEQVHRQEEMIRGSKAVVQPKQAQWLNWESEEKRKLVWWKTEQSCIRFLIGTTYDVLPSPQNIKLWVKESLWFIVFRYRNIQAYPVRL